MSRYFRAPMQNSLKITSSIIVLALFAALTVARGPSTYIVPALIVLSTLLVVRGYSVGQGKLVIHGLLWSKAYDLARLTDAKALPYATRGSLRSFGNGGLWSIFGYFKSPTLGSYLAYVTDAEKEVVLDFLEDTRLVVSPDDPVEFVRAVREEYRHLRPV